MGSLVVTGRGKLLTSEQAVVVLIESIERLGRARPFISANLAVVVLVDSLQRSMSALGPVTRRLLRFVARDNAVAIAVEKIKRSRITPPLVTRILSVAVNVSAL
jgi:hypothetical protein